MPTLSTLVRRGFGGMFATRQGPFEPSRVHAEAVDRGLQVALELFEPERVLKAHKRHCHALATGTGRAAHAVHIGGRIVGKFKVHHKVERIDVQTARGHVGSDEDIQRAFAEFVHDATALRLRELRAERFTAITQAFESLGDAVSGFAEVREDDAALFLAILQEIRQKVKLFRITDKGHTVIQALYSEVGVRRRVDAHEVHTHLVDEFFDAQM